jgi:hypothetical protein
MWDPMSLHGRSTSTTYVVADWLTFPLRTWYVWVTLFAVPTGTYFVSRQCSTDGRTECSNWLCSLGFCDVSTNIPVSYSSRTYVSWIQTEFNPLCWRLWNFSWDPSNKCKRYHYEDGSTGFPRNVDSHFHTSVQHPVVCVIEVTYRQRSIVYIRVLSFIGKRSFIVTCSTESK